MAGAAGAKGPITDINVTPLVDVCLVLVIIFMVLAPLVLQAGIDIASSKAGAAKGRAALKKNVSVELDKKGALTVDGRRVSWQGLPGALKAAIGRSADRLVSIKAAPEAKVGQVVEILDDSRQNGARKLAIINPE
jgi:biopolymer transport protein TolR